MIKTLRITSIVAAVLAAIFFVLPVVIGIRSDEYTKATLNSPGIIEEFNKAMGNKAKTGQSQISPLVQQAGTFALYLNPPKPTVPKTPAGRGATITRGPAVTPKFKVLGTSFYKGCPESSIALIDEPGKGLHWVRQSGKIGHLSIEQVKDGLIVVKDNGRTYEVAAEQTPETSLLEGASAVPSRRAGVSSQAPEAAGSKSTLPALRRAGAGITEAKSGTPQPNRSAEEDAEFNELVEKLQEIQRSYKSDKTGSVPSAKEKEAMMNKLISKFKNSRLSAEEAKK